MSKAAQNSRLTLARHGRLRRIGDYDRAVTKAELEQAAETLARLIVLVDAGELDAPAWYTDRLIGALAATLQRLAPAPDQD